jgi:nitrite reductase/ring-hydroxylating ferredoxin subunit
MFGKKSNDDSKSKSETKFPRIGGLASILKNESAHVQNKVESKPAQNNAELDSKVNSEPDLLKPSTSKSVNLIQQVQKLDDNTIRPFIDYTEGHVFYPVLSEIGETQNNVSYLDDLVSDGILSKHIYEKLIVCPIHPNVFSSSMRLYCPKCTSMNVEKLNLFEHKKCGYIAESKNFDFSNTEHSICPACQKEIKNFEKEIRVPAMWYQCEDCKEKFDNAVIKLHCRKHDHDFDTNSGKFITTFCYKLKNSDISNISDTTQIKDELVKLLCGFNFTAELNSLVKGKSGNMHEIPIFGKSKSNDDSILIFIKNQSTGVDESDMNSILIPKLDIEPKNTLLVTVSDVKEGVETMAKHYGINLISDPDFSKIISRVEEFVSAWYENNGGRK